MLYFVSFSTKVAYDMRYLLKWGFYLECIVILVFGLLLAFIFCTFWINGFTYIETKTLCVKSKL